MFAGLWNLESSPSITRLPPCPLPRAHTLHPNKLDWPSAITQGLPFTQDSGEAGWVGGEEGNEDFDAS